MQEHDGNETGKSEVLTAVLPQSEMPPWCDTCNAHIVPMARRERWLSQACYWLAMHWPDRWFVTKAHLAILPWAGNVAYRCMCKGTHHGQD